MEKFSNTSKRIPRKLNFQKKETFSAKHITNGKLNDYLNYLVNKGNKLERGGCFYFNMGSVIGNRVGDIARSAKSQAHDRLRTTEQKYEHIKRECPYVISHAEYILVKQKRHYDMIVKGGYEYSKDLYLIAPLLVNLEELRSFFRGGSEPISKGPERLNHFVLIIYDVSHKYLYLLDSLADKLVEKFVKGVYADTLFRTDLFTSLYSKFVVEEAKSNEIKVVSFKEPQQKTDLCSAYVAYYAHLFIEMDKEPYEVFDESTCNDDYIENVWIKQLGEIVNML